MQDAFLGRMWADHHHRAAGDSSRPTGPAQARAGTVERDGLPLVAHAMALVLAVSLASLSVGATLA